MTTDILRFLDDLLAANIAQGCRPGHPRIDLVYQAVELRDALRKAQYDLIRHTAAEIERGPSGVARWTVCCPIRTQIIRGINCACTSAVSAVAR